MLRRAFDRRAFRALLSAAALTVASGAAAPSDNVEGVVTAVDGGYVTLRSDDGHTHRFHVGNRTHVVFQSPRDEASFPNAKIDVLAEGMRIRVNPEATAGAVLDRVHVLSVPESARVPRVRSAAPMTPTVPAGPAGQVVKARLQSVETRRGLVHADVAGHSQTYRVSTRSALRRFEEGDLVLLTFDRDGNVSDIREALVIGRVTRVSGSRVTIDVGGSSETYLLDKKVHQRLRVGDSVSFEVEDRPGGQKVITAVH
jgi:Cu/Ag efflux protein CusF